MARSNPVFMAMLLGVAHDVLLHALLPDDAVREPDARTPLDKLNDVTATATDPGNAFANDYLLGMANGLILARHIVSESEDDTPPYLSMPQTTTQEERPHPMGLSGGYRRTSAADDLSGHVTRGRARGGPGNFEQVARDEDSAVHEFADITQHEDGSASAVSRDFQRGMDHAFSQVAQRDEQTYTAERERERDDMLLQLHMGSRERLLHLAVHAVPGDTSDIIRAARRFYEFACFGEERANLGLATTAELSGEIAARYEMGHCDPDYRTVKPS